MLGWAAALPEHWDLVVTLWWIATGEVRVDTLVDWESAASTGLPEPVRAALLPG